MRLPTYGSLAILNANAEKFSLSSALLVLLDPSSRIPVMAGLSMGEGKKSIMASNIAWIPLFLKADPQITGTISPLNVRVLRPVMI